MNFDGPGFSIEQVYSWASGASLGIERDEQERERRFLVALHGHLASGAITPTGFPNGGGEPSEIPKSIWLNYRPSFADGGCAVRVSANSRPVISMFFGGASGSHVEASFAPGDHAVKWSCLRFSKKEIAKIFRQRSVPRPCVRVLNETDALALLEAERAKLAPGRILSQKAGVAAIKAIDPFFDRGTARELVREVSGNARRGRPPK